jgi:hypothetical protein
MKSGRLKLEFAPKEQMGTRQVHSTLFSFLLPFFCFPCASSSLIYVCCWSNRCTCSLAEDVLHGFRQAPKSLPPKWFYDERGSVLFDQICDTPESVSSSVFSLPTILGGRHSFAG